MKCILISVCVFVGLCYLFGSYKTCQNQQILYNYIRLANFSHKINSSDKKMYIDDALTFTGRSLCNVGNTRACHSSNKSLIFIFWSAKSRSKWVANNILSAFPIHSFDHVIFVFDNSTWTSHSGYQHFIWIHVYNQYRLWYSKRFLSSSLIKSYRYIWCVDDDSQLKFNPLHYECVLDHFRIPFSSLGRLGGAVSFPFTKVNETFKSRIGRWTDFVETGPTVVATSKAWLCINEYIDAATSSGWGLGWTWCNMLAEVCFPHLNRTNICAILDAFGIEHQSLHINSGSVGASELLFYKNRYPQWIAKIQTYGSLAQNDTIFQSCRQ